MKSYSVIKTMSGENVRKRNGELQAFQPNKIQHRIRIIADEHDLHINVDMLTRKIINRVYNEITTREIDEITSGIAASYVVEHPDYAWFASNIVVSDLHKTVDDLSLGAAFRKMLANTDVYNRPAPQICDRVMKFYEANADALETMIDHSYDFKYSYGSILLLMRSYLKRLRTGEIAETPQHMLMRVALGIWAGTENALDDIRASYEQMRNGFMTHATPTLFNAGTNREQLSSCFLLSPAEDSLESIYDYAKNCAMISKHAGGIGSHVHKIRCANSYIASTSGHSNGLSKMLPVINATAEYVDQSGKRPGSHAVYIELWHADIQDVLNLKHPRQGRARSLFYAAWINDEFMRTLEREQQLANTGIDEALWYLMDPAQVADLPELYDEMLYTEWIDEPGTDASFTRRYREYIAAGVFVKRVRAREIWHQICELSQETGIPFKLHKDAINRKSNQKNIGTVQSSNLCTEIVQYTSADEIAVCNLVSICVNRFVRESSSVLASDIEAVCAAYDWAALRTTVHRAVRNLDRVIDITYYPLPQARRSNLAHRPMGIGIQGLADAFSALGLEFGSNLALQFDCALAEFIYYEALTASAALAAEYGTYSSYAGSPASTGKFQPDLWQDEGNAARWPQRCDWTALRKHVESYGLRNSLLVAYMPTSSTSVIMNNSPAFEPHAAIIFKRKAKTGEIITINEALQRELLQLGVWDRVKNKIMNSRSGSIGEILEIPRDVRKRYITSYELDARAIIKHAITRAPYIDQSQSMSLFVAEPTTALLTRLHFFAWRRGIKTACYYLRRLTSVDARKIHDTAEPAVCKLDDPDCASCSA